MIKIRHLVIAALLCGVIATANASSISPIAGTSSSIRYGAIANVIDGIINYDSFLGLGADNPPTGSAYGEFPDPSSVRFELGGSFDLVGMNLWNNAGYIGNDGEGINAFTLEFLDATYASVGSYSGNADDWLAEQSLIFQTAMNNVRYIDLIVHSNHSAEYFIDNPDIQYGSRDYADFYEISFNTVPEPATIIQLGLGLVGLAWLRKRIQN